MKGMHAEHSGEICILQGMSDPDSSGGGKSGASRKNKLDVTPKTSKPSSSASPKKASTATSNKTKSAAPQKEATSAKSAQAAEPPVAGDEGYLMDVDVDDDAPISAPRPVGGDGVQRKDVKKVKRDVGAAAVSKVDKVKSKQAGKSETKTQQTAAVSGGKAANVEQKAAGLEQSTSGKVGAMTLLSVWHSRSNAALLLGNARMCAICGTEIGLYITPFHCLPFAAGWQGS